MMAKKKSGSDAQVEGQSFEEQLEQLDQIVGQLESGQLGLEESLKQYELGIRILKSCHGVLQESERKIELLSGIDAEGNPITQPYDEEEESLEEKGESRSRRRTSTEGRRPAASRSKAKPASGDVDDSPQLF
ncbi:MAG: exodeoxyribonuclease VII small subunit [Pirellulaceae bacterium]